MTYELPFKKVNNAATYKQIKWLLSYENVSCDASTSQLMKRLPSDDFDELIEVAKSGELLIIED